MNRLLSSRPLFWLLLALPSFGMIYAALRPGADLEELLHPTGEFSVRFLVIAMALTPLVQLFPANQFLRWLMKRRRALGLAAFGYAALHTLFYVVAMGNLDDMLAELGATGIWTGWLAMLLFVPMAVTSNDAAMRALRQSWKLVQRLAYPAALLTLAHWVTVHDGAIGAAVHFAPLAVLEAARLFRNWRPA